MGNYRGGLAFYAHHISVEFIGGIEIRSDCSEMVTVVAQDRYFFVSLSFFELSQADSVVRVVCVINSARCNCNSAAHFFTTVGVLLCVKSVDASFAFICGLWELTLLITQNSRV